MSGLVPALAGTPLVIGLVNNASDAAFDATERQFRGLLQQPNQARRVQVRSFTLPGVARRISGATSPALRCLPIDAITATKLDALIVTGAEPSGGDLAEEPFWPAMTRLLSWAESERLPMLLSCLAAHAAVQHFDGIRRVRLHRKSFGIFRQQPRLSHPLLQGLGGAFEVAHSRQHALDEDELRRFGYTILSGSAEAGVDMFLRHGASVSLCLQGHPEYEPQTLLNQYRRDVGRYLDGRIDTYPSLPAHCMNATAARRMLAFRDLCVQHPGRASIVNLPAMVAAVSNVKAMQATSCRLMTNWLDLVANEKAARQHVAPPAFKAAIADLPVPVSL